MMRGGGKTVCAADGAGRTVLSVGNTQNPAQSIASVKVAIMPDTPGGFSFPGSSWDVIDEAQKADNHWEGTFNFDGSALYEGRLLSRNHADILSIVSAIRGNHETDLVSNAQILTYSPDIQYVRLACSSHLKSAHAVDRKRKGSTQRFIEGCNEQCGCVLNMKWTKVGESYAWVIGKIDKHHDGHPRPQQKVAKLTEEQRKLFGEEMMDAGLTAPQVTRSCIASNVIATSLPVLGCGSSCKGLRKRRGTRQKTLE
jgi:hypothetical protein